MTFSTNKWHKCLPPWLYAASLMTLMGYGMDPSIVAKVPHKSLPFHFKHLKLNVLQRLGMEGIDCEQVPFNSYTGSLGGELFDEDGDDEVVIQVKPKTDGFLGTKTAGFGTFKKHGETVGQEGNEGIDVGNVSSLGLAFPEDRANTSFEGLATLEVADSKGGEEEDGGMSRDSNGPSNADVVVVLESQINADKSNGHDAGKGSKSKVTEALKKVKGGINMIKNHFLFGKRGNKRPRVMIEKVASRVLGWVTKGGASSDISVASGSGGNGIGALKTPENALGRSISLVGDISGTARGSPPFLSPNNNLTVSTSSRSASSRKRRPADSGDPPTDELECSERLSRKVPVAGASTAALFSLLSQPYGQSVAKMSLIASSGNGRNDSARKISGESTMSFGSATDDLTSSLDVANPAGVLHKDLKFLVWARRWSHSRNTRDSGSGQCEEYLVTMPPSWVFGRRAGPFGFQAGNTGSTGSGSFLRCGEDEGREVLRRIKRMMAEDEAGRTVSRGGGGARDRAPVDAPRARTKLLSIKLSCTRQPSPTKALSLSLPACDDFAGNMLADEMSVTLDKKKTAGDRNPSAPHFIPLKTRTLNLSRLCVRLPSMDNGGRQSRGDAGVQPPRLSSDRSVGHHLPLLSSKAAISGSEFMNQIHGALGPSPFPLRLPRRLPGAAGTCRALQPARGGGPERVRTILERSSSRRGGVCPEPFESPHPHTKSGLGLGVLVTGGSAHQPEKAENPEPSTADVVQVKTRHGGDGCLGLHLVYHLADVSLSKMPMEASNPENKEDGGTELSKENPNCSVSLGRHGMTGQSPCDKISEDDVMNEGIAAFEHRRSNGQDNGSDFRRWSAFDNGSLCMSFLFIFRFISLLADSRKNRRLLEVKGMTSKRARKKPFKLAMCIAVLCFVLPPIHCSDAKKKVSLETYEQSFSKDLEQLKELDGRLNRMAGDDSDEVDSVEILSELSKVVKGYLSKINRVRMHIHNDDNEGAAAAIRQSIGNLKTFTDMTKNDKNLARLGSSAEASGNDLSADDKDIAAANLASLDEIPDSQLAHFIEPQMFDDIADISKDILDSMDPSMLAPSRADLKDMESSILLHDRKKEESGLYKQYHAAREQFNFYSNGSTGRSGKIGTGEFSEHYPSLKYTMSRHLSAMNGRLSKMGRLGSFFSGDEAVMAKHKIRQNALGDTCNPQCEPEEWLCNCRNLFSCVKKMTRYDLAVLISGGYINTQPDADGYGNYTVHVTSLRLFDSEEGVSAKLARVQGWAENDDPDLETCKKVLNEMFTACDPSKDTCTNPNVESFDLSTEEVCDVVDTSVKLLFEVMGDEFDGFVDKSADRKCQPLSFQSCGDFVAEFDRLYVNRNSVAYPQDNPMLRADPKYYTACGSSDTDCTKDPNATDVAEKHNLRCCADSDLGAGWIHDDNCPSDTVWANSKPDGTCHTAVTEKVDFYKGKEICEVNGGRLCTKEELLSNCARGSACGLDKHIVWTATRADLMYYTACGSSDTDCTMEPNAANVAEKHNLRCCADSDLGDGWIHDDNCPSAVWANSRPNGTCHTAVTEKVDFYKGKEICEVNRGRLCTKEELLNDCAIGSGCGLDKHIVWTSTQHAALQSMTTEEIFHHVRFPTEYWYHQNDNGIIDRTFGGTPVSQNIFSLVNPMNGRALGLRGDDCESFDSEPSYGPLVEVQAYEGNERQQFYVNDDDEIVSVACHSPDAMVITQTTGNCDPGAQLALRKTFRGTSSPGRNKRQRWRFKLDGSIRNVGCPDLAISLFDEEVTRVTEHDYYHHFDFSFVNSDEGKVLGSSGDGDSCSKMTSLAAEDPSILGAMQLFKMEKVSGDIFRLWSVDCLDGRVVIRGAGCADGTSIELQPAFANRDDLVAAVDACASLDCSDMQGTYGWPMGSWNVRRVSDMSSLFFEKDEFNENLNWWDVSRVTNMRSMFYGASSFNGDVSGWDTSLVTSMSRMFKDASSFDQKVAGWDTSRVTYMASMFYGASSFNDNLSNWDTSSVENMREMFRGAKKFNGRVAEWDTSRVTEIREVFREAYSFNGDISSWNVGNITDMSYMFSEARKFNRDVLLWDTSRVTDMKSMFSGASEFDRDVSEWNTSKVVYMNYMFYEASKFNRDISDWSTSSLAKISGMFCRASRFNIDLSNWDTSSVTDMDYVFKEASSFNGDISGWDTTKVTTMSWMFKEASKFNVDVSGWDVSKVKWMTSMFYKASKFNRNLCGWRDKMSYSKVLSMFKYSGCDDTSTPDASNNKCCHDCDRTGTQLSSITAPDAAKLEMENDFGIPSEPLNTEKDLDDLHRRTARTSAADPDTPTAHTILEAGLVETETSTDNIGLRDQWKINDDGTIRNVYCEDENMFVGYDSSNGDVHLGNKIGESHKWSMVSPTARMLPSDGKLTQVWQAQFVEPPYNYALVPGFPGNMETVDNNQCLESTGDSDLAKSAMRACDRSMTLLLGKQMSLGTLRSVAELVNDSTDGGPEHMPGSCCFDTPTTSDENFGVHYEPPMVCQNPGPWHLGISGEACANAGGQWFRNPCTTLKECIDDRPSRFDLDSPTNGACQESLEQLDTTFVSVSTSHDNFTHENNAHGCNEFCHNLPDYSSQVGMMIGGSANNATACVCLYKNGMLPSGELLPNYSNPSPPIFSLISQNNGTALGLTPKSDCDAEELSIELQKLNSSPRQQFQLTYDGRIVSVFCPGRVLSVKPDSGGCSSGSPLKALAAVFDTTSTARLQRWRFDSNGTISNVECPDLGISSMKKSDASLTSIYFALENPATQLAIGIVGSPERCDDKMDIELQELVYGDPAQQFMRVGDEIVSVMCPELAIEISGDDCSTASALRLLTNSNDTSDDERKWKYDDDSKTIESIKCSGMFLAINGASSAGVQTVPFRWDQFLLNDGLPGSPTSKNTSHYNSTDAPNATNYTQTPIPETLEWNDHTPPAVGSTLSLSNRTGQYMKWTKKHQQFRPLMGPFSLFNPTDTASIGVEGSTCSHGMMLESQDDNASSIDQLFYLGKHGSIFSSACPGLVISVTNPKYYTVCGSLLNECTQDPQVTNVTERHSLRCCADSDLGAGWTQNCGTAWDVCCPWDVWANSKPDDMCHNGEDTKVNFYEGKEICEVNGGRLCTKEELLKNCAKGTGCNLDKEPVWTSTEQTEHVGLVLQTFKLGESKMKWKFVNGTIESVKYPGRVIDRDGTMITIQNTASSLSQRRERINARLLTLNSLNNYETAWKQRWTAVFSTPGIDQSVLQLNGDADGETMFCYKPNPAFSPSFDEFASNLVIKDASDETQCKAAREQLGFEDDHPFDVEVCDSFNEYMCDPMFTGVDHSGGEWLEELEEPPQFEFVDYEEAEYEAAEYEEANYEEAPKFKTVDYEEFSAEEHAEFTGEIEEVTPEYVALDKENMSKLTRIAKGVRRSKDAETAATHLWMLRNKADALKCDLIPTHVQLPVVGIVPNPFYKLCKYSSIIFLGISYAFLLASRIANRVMIEKFALNKLKPYEAVYGYEYTKLAYKKTEDIYAYSKNAFKTIHRDMKDQHNDMRNQLQQRHKDIADHIGQDIADAHNTLGQGIVTSQNTLGIAIVNAQNANGQAIVNAQNALGEHIVKAQNANGQAIVDSRNAIATQHNRLGEWLHGSLCMIYNAIENGACASFIGPLEEDQTYIPVELYSPEGQLSMAERMHDIEVMGENIQRTLENLENSLMTDVVVNGIQVAANDARNILEGGGNSKYLQEIKEKVNAVEDKLDSKIDAVDSKMNEIEGKMDAVEDKLESKIDAVDGKVNEMDVKIDAVEGKVNEMDDKMDAVEGMVNEMDDKMDAVEGKVNEMGDKMDEIEGKMGMIHGEIKEMKNMILLMMEQNKKESI